MDEELTWQHAGAILDALGYDADSFEELAEHNRSLYEACIILNRIFEEG